MTKTMVRISNFLEIEKMKKLEEATLLVPAVQEKFCYYSSPHLGLTDSLKGENPCLH